MADLLKKSNNFYSCCYDAAEKSARFYTNLTDDDIKYLEAYQRNDKATLVDFLYTYAMKAFANTVVKHTVWRRDAKPDIWVYDVNRKQKTDAGWLGRGVYFYGNEDECAKAWTYGGFMQEFFINVEKPFDLPLEFHDYISHKNEAKVSERMTEVAKRNDFDGIIWTGDGREEWCVLKSNQMKRAQVTQDDDGRVIPISLRFNLNSPDNRF